MDDFGGPVQEGLLAVLLYDPEGGKRVANLVPVESYDLHYREVAAVAVRYWKAHKRPPGEHAVDLIDEVIAAKPKDKSVYKRMFKSIRQTRADLNADYLLDRAAKFVRRQRVKTGILEAVELLQSGRDDEAERTLMRAAKNVVNVYDTGVRLTDVARSLRFLDTALNSGFRTGIPELDRRGLGPARKESSLFIAPPGRGKSQWLVHLGKHGLLDRRTVAHVTLEMSEDRVCQRYVQSLFAVSKREEQLYRTVLERDELGRVCGIEMKPMGKRPSFEDDNIRGKLVRMIQRRLGHRPRLYIKEFPSGQATVRDIGGYLEMLGSEGVNVDLLLVDYADLFRLDTRHKREELGQIYVDLRGLAVERNIAVATASQSNRDSMKKKQVTEDDVAEDISKIATVDTAFTYSRTAEEKRRNLARLLVAKARNDEDKMTILLSQNYALAQFCIESAMMTKHYEEVLSESDSLDESDE